MSEIPNVIGGDTATAAWANDVKNRTAMRYADALARDASLPAPADGELAYLQNIDQLTMRAGSVWVAVAADGAQLVNGFQSPGVIIASKTVEIDNVANGGLVAFISVPGSRLTNTCTVEVNGVGQLQTLSGRLGVSITGVGVVNDLGNSVSANVAEYTSFFRAASVPLAPGSNTLNVLSHSDVPQNTHYRLAVRVWINP